MSALALSACIEVLFTEDRPRFADRIRAAAAAGCPAIEVGTWRDKPLDEIGRAASDNGVVVATAIVEPQVQLVDPGRRPEALAAVRASAAAAVRIGCQTLIVTSGSLRTGVPNAEQDEALTETLRQAALVVQDEGIGLLLEPLNTRVDHPSAYLCGTRHGLDLIERIDRAEVRLLLDMYHSATMGEQLADVLDDRVDLVGHVHVADTGGRHEPSTGTIAWLAAIKVLYARGYRGRIGLEYLPTVDSAESMRPLRRVLDQVAR
jgi:hydroxypyruvate isomerase